MKAILRHAEFVRKEDEVLLAKHLFLRLAKTKWKGVRTVVPNCSKEALMAVIQGKIQSHIDRLILKRYEPIVRMHLNVGKIT